jgi:hypothetical protein
MSQDHNHLSHSTWECKYHVVFVLAKGFPTALVVDAYRCDHLIR